MSSNMLTAESVYRFLIANLQVKEGKLDVQEYGDYLVLSIINTRYKLSIQKTSTVLVFMARLARLLPKRSQRLRDVILVHRRWASIDAMCILYARRMRQRLICAGRPEAVSTAVKLYKPDTLTTLVWEPTILDACRDREILLYYTTEGSRVYICKLRENRRYTISTEPGQGVYII